MQHGRLGVGDGVVGVKDAMLPAKDGKGNRADGKLPFGKAKFHDKHGNCMLMIEHCMLNMESFMLEKQIACWT